MNQNEISILNDLLSISPKDRIGETLLKEWGTLTNLYQNIDAADLTPRQRKVLSAAKQVLFVREERPLIQSPADTAALLADLKTEIQEHFIVLVLDRRNRILERVNLYKGNASSIQVRPGEIFRKAIILNASAIIIAHNHPSGDPTPSPDDVAVTRAVVAAGKILDVDVLDHIVIGIDGFVSLKERGLGFS
jgi:DNA repair protein radc